MVTRSILASFVMRLIFGAAVASGLATPALAQLKIDNIKARHGRHGSERANLEIMPGDELIFTYTISGLGNAEYDGFAEVTVFSEDGKRLGGVKENNKDVLAFGGGTVSAWSALGLSSETPPGKYTVKVAYDDKKLEKSVSFERQIVVLKPDFAIVRPRFFSDRDGKIPAGATVLAGGNVYFRLSAVGFDRSTKRIDLTMTVECFDEKGKALMEKPMTLQSKIDNEAAVAANKVLALNGSLWCNRPGEFRVRITVTDNIAKKATSYETPLKVTD